MDVKFRKVSCFRSHSLEVLQGALPRPCDHQREVWEVTELRIRPKTAEIQDKFCIASNSQEHHTQKIQTIQNHQEMHETCKLGIVAKQGRLWKILNCPNDLSKMKTKWIIRMSRCKLSPYPWGPMSTTSNLREERTSPRLCSEFRRKNPIVSHLHLSRIGNISTRTIRPTKAYNSDGTVAWKISWTCAWTRGAGNWVAGHDKFFWLQNGIYGTYAPGKTNISSTPTRALTRSELLRLSCHDCLSWWSRGTGAETSLQDLLIGFSKRL